MAKREVFEDHCWKDVIPEHDLKTYESFARETYIGKNPAMLCIDLYNLVYKGGAGEPHELDPDFPNSCGRFAHEAIEPTKKLFEATRAAGVPIPRLPAEARMRREFHSHVRCSSGLPDDGWIAPGVD